jgi:hypothetical protein
MLQGVGLGLMIVSHLKKGGTIIASLVALATLLILNFVFSGGARSTVFSIAIIAFCLVDVLHRPISMLLLGFLAINGLLAFEVIEIIRDYPPSEYFKQAPAAAERLLSPDRVRGKEFRAMLEKESICIKEFSKKFPDYQLLLNELLFFVPSQFNPLKAKVQTTTAWLTVKVLGQRRYAKGEGVAGSTIGDAYRVGGPIGIVVFGGIFSFLLRIAQYLLLNSSYSSAGDRFVCLCLWLICVSSILYFARGDLGLYISTLIYLIVIPYLFWTYFARSFISLREPSWSSVG